MELPPTPPAAATTETTSAHHADVVVVSYLVQGHVASAGGNAPLPRIRFARYVRPHPVQLSLPAPLQGRGRRASRLLRPGVSRRGHRRRPLPLRATTRRSGPGRRRVPQQPRPVPRGEAPRHGGRRGGGTPGGVPQRGGERRRVHRAVVPTGVRAEARSGGFVCHTLRGGTPC
jgi:hypothetical protein